jgi:hypothetical protein
VIEKEIGQEVVGVVRGGGVPGNSAENWLSRQEFWSTSQNRLIRRSDPYARHKSSPPIVER